MVAAWLLVAFLAVESVQGVSSLQYEGQGIVPTNTITVSGTGDAYAIPNLGEFTYSVVSDKSTVAAAQADATTKANAVTDYLKGAGVAAIDIKTTDYSISAQYEYQSAACPNVAVNNGATDMPIYCPPGKQVLTGYEVRQSNDVKVRDTGKAGDLLAGVGGKGATEVSGLSFTVEDPTAVNNQARDKAIADAKAKAQDLAKSLGVSLVRVVSFTESNGGNPMPLYGMEMGMTSKAVSAAPNISPGQNKVTSNVSITYEIR